MVCIVHLQGPGEFTTEPRCYQRPSPQKCFPRWRASHSTFEARREENEANQQQSRRGGGSDASRVTGFAWHPACLGGEGAFAPPLSSAGVRASDASPWAAVVGAGSRCKASDRLRLAWLCRRYRTICRGPAGRVLTGQDGDRSEPAGGGEPRSRVRRRWFRRVQPRPKAASICRVADEAARPSAGEGHGGLARMMWVAATSRFADSQGR